MAEGNWKQITDNYSWTTMKICISKSLGWGQTEAESIVWILGNKEDGK